MVRGAPAPGVSPRASEPGVQGTRACPRGDEGARLSAQSSGFRRLLTDGCGRGAPRLKPKLHLMCIRKREYLNETKPVSRFLSCIIYRIRFRMSLEMITATIIK